MRAIAWLSGSLSSELRARLSIELVVTSSAEEFLDAQRGSDNVSFLDLTTLAELDQLLPGPALADRIGHFVVISEESLQRAISALPAHPGLGHVVNESMLRHPMATEHIANVIRTLTSDSRPRLLDWLGDSIQGRRVRLAHASRRVERLERMGEFFETNGFGSRTIEQLRDVAEELLTNAFYDAPVAAGAVKQPISRTQDVALPEDSACDLVYACRADLAIVRVRDPFGALTRSRLVEVLTRCARTDMQVEVDESMGGAGLGLWRIFSVATFVAISVVKGRHTEFLVGIGKRAAGARPYGFHLFFRDSAKRRFWKLSDEHSSDLSINKSVAILAK